MSHPEVAIIMGSDSDLPTMQAAIAVCEDFKVTPHVEIISAHRTPQRMVEFAQQAHQQGIKVIIAGAGGAAHLPGMVAALSPLPVIGVPVASRHLKGLDSLYSIVQMPGAFPWPPLPLAMPKMRVSWPFKYWLLSAQNSKSRSLPIVAPSQKWFKTNRNN